jgi:hypothetical protein
MRRRADEPCPINSPNDGCSEDSSPSSLLPILHQQQHQQHGTAKPLQQSKSGRKRRSRPPPSTCIHRVVRIMALVTVVTGCVTYCAYHMIVTGTLFPSLLNFDSSPSLQMQQTLQQQHQQLPPLKQHDMQQHTILPHTSFRQFPQQLQWVLPWLPGGTAYRNIASTHAANAAFHFPQPPSSGNLLSDHSDPDFNGLNLRLDEGSFDRRQIAPDAVKRFEKERKSFLKQLDADAEDVSERYLPMYELWDEDPDRTCFRTAWREDYHLNCNSVHEHTLVRPYDSVHQPYQIQYRGSGYYRDSWEYVVPDTTWSSILLSSVPTSEHASASWVIKRFKMEHTVCRKYQSQMHKEALIMDQLTGSPRIVDIYGHCGLTMVAEHMVEEVTPRMTPFPERHNINRHQVKKEQADGVHPYNNLTLTEKLDLAILMAESLADIHGFAGGVIAHGDTHPVQWLKNAQGVSYSADTSLCLNVA